MTYTEQELRDALSHAATNPGVILVRGRRRAPVLVAAVAVAAVVAGVFGATRLTPDRARPLGDLPASTSTPTSTPTGEPPGRPPRLTLAAAAARASSYPLRPYSGPVPPVVDEARAVAGRPGAYVLGLRDVRVAGNGRPGSRWRSVYVVAAEVRTEAPATRPGGWVQSVTLVDATSGAQRFTTRQVFLDERPPKPAPFTLTDVRRRFSSQRFRTFTGLTPPLVSAARILERQRGDGSYLIGLVDVSFVDGEDRTLGWRSVWVVGTTSYVADLNAGCLGCGLSGRGGFRSPPTPPRPGWARTVSMFDTRSGAFVLGGS